MNYRISMLLLQAMRRQITSAVEAYEKAAKTPFDIPVVLQPLLSRDEFLGLLRARINKGYMPSATGDVQYNSKPEYIRSLSTETIAEDARVFFAHGCSGYFATESWAHAHQTRDIWCYLRAGNVAFITNLTTDATYVALANEDLGVVVTWTDQLVAVDRVALDNEIDIYC